MGHWVSRNIRHSLREKRIAVYQGKCVNVSKTHVTLESNETRDLRYDLLVWATGAAAPTVLKNTGLQLGTCCNQRHREGLALFSNGLLQTTGDTYSWAKRCKHWRDLKYSLAVTVVRCRGARGLPKLACTPFVKCVIFFPYLENFVSANHYMKQGPFVAQNILKLLRGHHLTNYHPQKVRNQFDRHFLGL